MNVYCTVFFITHHCNSAPRVRGVAAGGYIFYFFPRGGFGFSYFAVSQSFHWFLISRDKSCILTPCYAIVQCHCVNKWLFEVPADQQANVSKLNCLSLIGSVGKIHGYCFDVIELVSFGELNDKVNT